MGLKSLLGVIGKCVIDQKICNGSYKNRLYWKSTLMMNLSCWSDAQIIKMIATYHRDVETSKYVKVTVVDPLDNETSTLFKLTGIKPYYLFVSVDNDKILAYFKKDGMLSL